MLNYDWGKKSTDEGRPVAGLDLLRRDVEEADHRRVLVQRGNRLPVKDTIVKLPVGNQLKTTNNT
jgi:hypothetical protein